MRPLEQLTHYEVLELDPAATADDVKRAFERLRQVFAPGSLATYSLVDTFDQQRMLTRLEEAFTVLSDPAARAAYDERNEIAAPVPRAGAAPARAPEPPPPAAPAPVPATAAAPALPPMPEIPADAEFTGELLRRVREARGFTVRQVADITRIGPNYLRSIEEEAFEQLPERVYLRGFLMSYARELRLDPNRVATSYLLRWESGRPRT